MSAADEALIAVADQLDKAKGEILALVSELEANNVDPAVVERLRSVAQGLDDVVPDVPPTP